MAIDEIKSLIIQQIKQVFGSLKVYDEPIKQGLKVPAFLVLVFDNFQERKLKGQVSRTYSFNVTYFPSQATNNELDGVYETFQNEFQYIANKHHVHRLDSVKQDGVLVITFTINLLLKEVKN